MRRETLERAGVTTLAALALVAAPAGAPAQHREYYVRGKIVDTAGEPVAGAAIELREADSSRSYSIRTDDDGVYKLAGLPHGVYDVSVAKDGYAAVQDRWDLDAPQSTMRRMEMPDLVLVSAAQVRKAQWLEEAGTAADEAKDRIREGDFDGAIALMQKVLDGEPDHPGALFLMGLSYAGKGLWADAADALSRVTELSPDFPGAHFELGICYAKLGDLDRALDEYSATLALDPGNASAAYNSGLILFQSNRIEEALERFEAGLAASPEDPDLHEMAGRCYIHREDFRRAVEHLERARALAESPDKAALLDRLIGEARPLVR